MMNLSPYLVPYTNMNSKWMIDLNEKPKNIKVGEKT